MHPVLALHGILRLHSPLMLCLHSVGEGADALPADAFRSLVEELVERKYRFLTADDVLGLRVLGHRNVLLTFDDGRMDNYTVVLPLLREYGIRATFYVCSELVGKRVTFPSHADAGGFTDSDLSFDLMNWTELRRMRDAGMSIGSHGATHCELTRCTDQELAAETEESRRILEENLNVPVRHFSYPWGRFDARVVSSLRGAGYQTGAAVSVNPRMTPRPWNEFMLPRVTVHPAASHPELRRLTGFGNLFRRAAGQTRRAVSGNGA
jgi:peptidoglycan/xylan/chitin deacetylase (PgdA/CDA1 family)